MNSFENTKIILASQSPRRRELMAQAGFEFEIVMSNVDERITKTVPAEVVMELSQQKAKDVFDGIISSIAKNCNVEDDLSLIVIGADTVVSVNDKIMGKPISKDDAFNMLKSIQDNTHQVYTGVTIFSHDFLTGTTNVNSFAECTDVSVYPMSDSEIYDYIATGDPMDKAGAYGIQGPFAVFVKEIKGDYNNVVGLPIAKLYHELRR